MLESTRDSLPLMALSFLSLFVIYTAHIQLGRTTISVTRNVTIADIMIYSVWNLFSVEFVDNLSWMPVCVVVLCTSISNIQTMLYVLCVLCFVKYEE